MSDWNQDCEALFEAGRQVGDDPSPEDRRRVARRVAARLAMGVTVVTTAEAGRAATTVAGASSLVAKAPSLLTAGKVLLALAVVGGGAALGGAVSRHPAAHGSLPSAAPSAASTLLPIPSARTEAVDPVEPPAAASALVVPAAPATPGRQARPSVKLASTPTADSTIASPSPASATSPLPGPHDATAEILALKAIDEAIRRGDFPRASALLDEYDATAGTKHFAPESQAARALVLCGSGRTAAGQKAACAFFSAYPRSPMSARLEAACSPRCGDR